MFKLFYKNIKLNSIVLSHFKDYFDQTFLQTNKYGNKYYAIADGRFQMVIDKTQNDKYFILSLPAISMTLKKMGLKNANICLAVGLPVVCFPSLKDTFRQFFIRDNIFFEFQGEKFNISIKEVFVFPQAYSSIFSNYSKYKDMSAVIIDFGAGTVDFFYMYKGILDIKRTGSYNMGIIQLFNSIKQEVLKKQILLDETQMLELIQGENNQIFIEQDIVDFIKEKTEEYLDKVLNQLKEDGFDIKVNAVLFVGGGAVLLKDYFSRNKNLNYFEIMPDSEFANVKGFEALAKQKIANSSMK